MNQIHIQQLKNHVCEISPEALALFARFCEIGEEVFHTQVPRPDILEKLGKLERPLMNKCFEDITGILSANKTIVLKSKEDAGESA